VSANPNVSRYLVGAAPHEVVHSSVGNPLHPYEGEASKLSYQNANRQSTSFVFATNQLHPHNVLSHGVGTSTSSFGERQSSMGENPFHPVSSSLGMIRNPLHPTGEDE
jgi:hypothetical protein